MIDGLARELGRLLVTGGVPRRGYNRRPLPAVAAAAVLTLVCCEVGYVTATQTRGGSNATSTVALWLTAAVLAGPPLDVAGARSSDRRPRRTVGFAVIGGVLIGAGIYGWTTVAATTDWRYWAIELVIGVGVVAAAVRSRRARDALAVLVTAGLTATIVFSVACTV